MMKWLITVLLVLIVFAVLAQRYRFRRMPGDFSIPVRGRMYYIPIASTLVLSLIVWLIGKVL
jgi:hypothetical protein